jgi:protein O-mannosyl-transferase
VLLWGMNPHGHHLTNVVLHAANAAWIFLLGTLLLRFHRDRISSAPRARDRSWALIGTGLAAILFAVHPLRAESVSWVSDRKDLLCAFFLVPAAMAYVVHSHRRGSASSQRWLLASFLLFVMAVLSKATAVAFPIVLLLLDWLGGRLDKRLLTEKIPFLLVSLVVAVLSLAMTSAPDTTRAYAVSHLTGLETILFPFFSLAFPLYKTLAPVHLGPIYPRVGLEWMIAGLAVVVSATSACVVLAMRGRKGVLVAWLTYLLLLIPSVAGLSSGMQPVADRYSYLSTISLWVLLGVALSSALEGGGIKRRLIVGLCGGTLAAVLLSLTIPQAARWRSSIALWEFVVAEFPAKRDYADAYLNLGAAYSQAGRRAEALAILDKAAAMDPDNVKVLYNLGIVSHFEGRRQKALTCLRRVTALDPRDAVAFYNRALFSEELGFYDESLSSMVQAARLGYKDAQEALTSRGIPW